VTLNDLIDRAMNADLTPYANAFGVLLLGIVCFFLALLVVILVVFFAVLPWEIKERRKRDRDHKEFLRAKSAEMLRVEASLAAYEKAIAKR
jgi:hypothetical protein